jgi:hypothetical protein
MCGRLAWESRPLAAELTGSPAGAIWTRSDGRLARFEIPASGEGGTLPEADIAAIGAWVMSN